MSEQLPTGPTEEEALLIAELRQRTGVSVKRLQALQELAAVQKANVLPVVAEMVERCTNSDMRMTLYSAFLRPGASDYLPYLRRWYAQAGHEPTYCREALETSIVSNSKTPTLLIAAANLFLDNVAAMQTAALCFLLKVAIGNSVVRDRLRVAREAQLIDSGVWRAVVNYWPKLVTSFEDAIRAERTDEARRHRCSAKP
jgi:hypothetical protein